MMQRLKKLITENCGSMAIETAIVAPMLVIMTLGTFEVGTVVARQHELQSAANEAEIIIMATNRGATIEVAEIQNIIQTSVGVGADNIAVEQEFRCNLDNQRVKIKGNCPTSAHISEYITISLSDQYTPTWTAFGIGKPITFSIDRSVQIS